MHETIHNTRAGSGNKEFSALLPFAETLADASGEVLRRYFGKPPTAELKADASPVTAADREAESAMRALIAGKFPHHGIFGEEGARVNPEAPLQWVLDPIDGTRSFLAGYLTFTTLIALCENGVPMLGVIDQPVLRERWTGLGSTATKKSGQTGQNGQPDQTGQTRKPADLSRATLATTSLDYFSEAERAAFKKLRAGVNTAHYGGDAYAYAMLAAGRIDIVADAAMKPYDFCALVPVVEAAGGVITDWRGAPLTLDSDGHVLAAATPELHAKAREFLV